jgi:hypothetical protein
MASDGKIVGEYLPNREEHGRILSNSSPLLEGNAESQEKTPGQNLKQLPHSTHHKRYHLNDLARFRRKQ